MSGLLNKVKSAVSGDHSTSTTHSTTTSTTHGVPEGTAGPHSSRVGNAADPRIDSDLDSSRQTGGLGHSAHNQTSGGLNSSTHNPLSSTHGTTHNTTSTHNPLSGSHGTGVGGTPYNTTGGSAYQSHVPATGNHSHTANQTTAGTHNSNLLNKADPTVDSDRVSGTHSGETFPSHHVGAGVHTGNHNNPAHSHVGGSSGVHHSNNPLSSSHPTSTSTHNQNLNSSTHNPLTHGNEVHHSNNPLSSSIHTTSTHNQGLNTSSHNPLHSQGNTGVASSDYSAPHSGSGTSSVGHVKHDISAAAHGSPAAVGSGNAPKTAGPHSSDLLNKLDPRVDSNLDGSKTYLGNATHK